MGYKNISSRPKKIINGMGGCAIFCIADSVLFEGHKFPYAKPPKRNPLYRVMDPIEFKGRMDVLKSLVLITDRQYPVEKATKVKKYQFGVDVKNERLCEMKYVPFGMTHRWVTIDLVPYEANLKDRIIVKALIEGAKKKAEQTNQAVVEYKRDEESKDE